jgi:hypothetical protein
MKDIEKRLAAVEAENADLKGQLAALQLLLGNKPVPPPRRDEPQVRITRPLSNVSLPTDDECVRLCEVVWGRYPTLRPGRGGEGEFVGQFRAAFQFVQHHGRRAEPDHQRGLGWWTDTARAWISQHRSGGLPIGGAVLVAAIIAAGDVPYTNPEDPGITIGLQFGGGGIPAKDWWRRALGGAILEPVPQPYPTRTPSPVRVQQAAVGYRRS